MLSTKPVKVLKSQKLWQKKLKMHITFEIYFCDLRKTNLTKKREKRKVWFPFPFLLFLPSVNNRGKHFFKYKKCDLESQIATHTNQDTRQLTVTKNFLKNNTLIHEIHFLLGKHTFSQYRQRKTWHQQPEKMAHIETIDTRNREVNCFYWRWRNLN